MFRLLSLLLICHFQVPVYAAIDAYPFPDDEMQARYDDLIEELRCPQCLNTNLAGSDAMIAQDLRREVHRMLLEGMTDDAILDFMYERYGDFILYEPRVGASTAVLWFGPALLLLLAAGIWFRVAVSAKKQREAVAQISPEERARLDRLLADQET